MQRLDQEACVILAKDEPEKRLEHMCECHKGSVHNPQHQRDSTHLQLPIVDNSPALYSSSVNIHGLMASSFFKRFKQEWSRDIGSSQSKYQCVTV